MNLAQIIQDNLTRIGATIKNPSGSALEILQSGIDWPNMEFQGSVDLFRKTTKELDGEDFEGWEDFEIGDEMPSLCQFRILPKEEQGSFWQGWEEEFSSVDATKMFPFAADSYYYYFIAANDSDASDPRVFSVDHEEANLEPFDENGLTVGRLLAMIIPAED